MKPLCYGDVVYGCHWGQAQIAETEASDATRLKRYGDRSTYHGLGLLNHNAERNVPIAGMHGSDCSFGEYGVARRK
jgi:hypothetical protein